MGWLVTCGVLLCLAALPLGVSARYNAEGPRVKIILGPVKLTVFPRQKKVKKEKTPPREGKTEESDPKEPPLPKPPQPPAPDKPETQQQTGGSLRDFLPLLKVALDFLGDLRRKIRLDDLEVKLVMAGGDPCDLAVNYGRAWAAAGNLMPQLERLFKIKKRNVEVACDFTATETRMFARLDATITLGRMFALAAVYGVRALKEYLKFAKKRKGGAENESETSQHAGNNHSEDP